MVFTSPMRTSASPRVQSDPWLLNQNPFLRAGFAECRAAGLRTALAENALEGGFLPYPDEFFVVNIVLARHRSAAQIRPVNLCGVVPPETLQND
jgi:hypothetical protein